MPVRVLALGRPPARAVMPIPTPGTSPREVEQWAQDMREVAARGDRVAFMRIYDHFMARLCLYLRGLGTPEPIAEELAQDALLRCWQHAASFDPARSALSTWLFRIARNLHLDRLRREAGHSFVDESEIDAEPEAGGSTESYADQAQLQRRIDALPPVQARLVRMSYFEARSHQEIATDLDLPLGTVKSHLRRAFLRLQGQLGDEP